MTAETQIVGSLVMIMTNKLTQKEFQSLMGELEVYGEVYIRATKPESLKI